MLNQRRRIALSAVLSAAVALPWIGACGDESGGGRAGAGSLIDDGAVVQALGWLGARAHPAPRALEVAEGEGSSGGRMVGGMVLTEVRADGALARAGLARGDVLVRVADAWLPNKEDPGSDLVRAVEAQVSSGANPIELGYWRAGAVASAALAHDQSPLEVGLPGPSVRLGHIATAGLDRLIELQGEGLSSPESRGAPAEISVAALAGLAYLAGGAREQGSPFADALEQCRQRIEAAIENTDLALDPWSAAFATMFLAELAGPLELELPSFAGFASLDGMQSAGGTFDLSAGLPEGAVVFGAGDELPPEIEELLKNLDLSGGEGSVSVSFVSAGPDGAPTGMGAPQDLDLDLPEPEPATGPLWTLDEIVSFAGEDAGARLAPVAAAVERLVALQHASGGWDPEDAGLGSCDATLATNQALFALGMAERVGAPVDSAALRRGIEFLREHTNDGHVFSTSAADFDRRREAGRSNGAAAALCALNCEHTDPFLRELVDYGEQRANTIPDAGAAVPLHVLNTAVLRRQQGLGAWAVFFEEFKDVFVTVQDPDGSFAPWAGGGDPALAIDALLVHGAARTALWSLVAGLQSDRVPVLLAQARNPLQTPISGEGIRYATGVMTLSGGSMQLGEGEFEELFDAAGVSGGLMVDPSSEGDE